MGHFSEDFLATSKLFMKRGKLPSVIRLGVGLPLRKFIALQETLYIEIPMFLLRYGNVEKQTIWFLRFYKSVFVQSPKKK